MLGGKNMKKEFVSKQQVNLLPERLRKAEETNATKDLKNYMWDLYKLNGFLPMHIMVVGSGDSYPAAIFAKHAIFDELSTPYVEAATAQTAIKILTQSDHINGGEFNPKYDLVIGISYSGKTPDIKYVSEICEKKGFNFLLLTGAEKSTLSDIYHENDNINIVSYYNSEDATGDERRIISMTSTLAPAIIFDDNYSCKLISDNQEDLVKGEQFVSELDIANIAKSIEQYPIVHVFYEWDTLPTAVDIENKFTQSGIANVVLHEKKNFSHGLYTSMFTQNFALVINLTRYVNSNINKIYKYGYDENLATFLSNICKNKSAHYIEIGTVAHRPAQWNIEAMTKLPYLITAIGEELGIDVSKPLDPFVDEALPPLYDFVSKL